jgi:pimeloyl-ACP methyl ester carboxylesterase
MREERRIALPSGETFVRSEGEGLPFVWTHGFSQSIDTEDGMGLGALLGRIPGVRLVRYDARGHGRSAAGRDAAAHAWDALGADLLALCDALGLERPVVGGVSMGVAATLHAAVRTAGRFAGLVLLLAPTAWETRPAQAAIYRGGAELTRERGVLAYVSAMREQLAATPGMTPALREALLAGVAARPAEELANVLQGAAASDLPEPAALASLTLPALVVAARSDPGHPLVTSERIARSLPHARLVVLESVAELATARPELEAFLSARARA